MTLPAPPRAEARPLQLRTPRLHDRGSLCLAEGPGLSEGRGRGDARLSQGRERLFRGGDGAAQGAGRHPVRGDEGADQGGRILGPGPRRRLALLVGVQAGRAISDLVPEAGLGRRRAGHLRRAGRGRRQGIFPARRRSRSAPTAGSPRPWSTTTARSGSSFGSATSRPARMSRPSPRSRSVTPVWTSDSRGDRLHRGQRELAKLSRPLPPARHARLRGRHPLRGDRGARLLRRGLPVAGRKPDLHRHRRQQHQRGAVRPGRRPGRAAHPHRAAPGETAIYGGCSPWQAVDPDQRRACELPARRGRRRRAGRVEDGDPRLGPGLSSRTSPPFATISPSRSGSTASTSSGCAPTTEARSGSRSAKPLIPPSSATIPNSRPTPTG